MIVLKPLSLDIQADFTPEQPARTPAPLVKRKLVMVGKLTPKGAALIRRWHRWRMRAQAKAN